MLKKFNYILLILNIILFVACGFGFCYIMNDLNTIKEEKEISDYRLMYDITVSKQRYYENYLLTDNNFEGMVEKQDSYYIYFHQEGCSACHDADPYINEYVISDKQDQKPVYFAIPELDKKLFEKFNIESTPTLVVVNNGSPSLITGYDSIKNELRK